jgi:hypothetical protein
MPGPGAPRGKGRRSVPALTLGLLLGVLAVSGPAAAQSGPDRLFESCRVADPAALEGSCADAALALQAFQGGLGLLMTAGGPIPASPSTAGRRLASQARIVGDLGVGWASFRHPDLGSSATDGVRSDRRSQLLGGRFTTAVGVFEGFSPAPNVGGVLSVDAVGTVQVLRHPRGAGDTGTLFQWGGGVRVGVFRESFTLPGLTLSAMHYRTGRLQYGEVEETGAEFTLDPDATSLRVVFGKDLLAVGLTAGVGWDRYGGTGSIRASAPGVSPPSVGPESASLRMTRGYLFAGANFTWVVTQFAGELVWARTGSPLGDFPGTGAHRPGSRQLQGAFSFRVTY